MPLSMLSQQEFISAIIERAGQVTDESAPSAPPYEEETEENTHAHPHYHVGLGHLVD